MDAVLLTPRVSSYVELSLSPVFRRRWPSIYEAIEDSRPDPDLLMQSYIEQIPQQQTPVLVGDHTSWSRPEAVTLRERTYEHAGSGIGGGKPITLGQGYSSLAWIPEEKGSWVLPLRHERITSSENPLSVSAQQLQKVYDALLSNTGIAFESQRLHWCLPKLGTPRSQRTLESFDAFDDERSYG